MRSNASSYISFLLGEDTYAIDVSRVLEVLEIQKITRLPNTLPFIRGIINFRNEVVPVIDTHIKIKLPELVETEKTVIIIIEIEYQEKPLIVGMLADGVQDVIQIQELSIKSTPGIGSEIGKQFVRGMLIGETGFIMIIDIDKVFMDDELDVLNGHAQSQDFFETFDNEE